MMRIALLYLGMFTVAANFPEAASAAGPERSQVCHYLPGGNAWQRLNVSDKAASGHVINHPGDALGGGQTSFGLSLGPECRVEVKYVRKNAAIAAAEADLIALKEALTVMKTMECDDPFSWYYQGATHSVPEFVDNGNPLCPSYITKQDLLWGWDTCTHKEGSEIHFLIWHRLFTAHFERIVRQLSGKSDFALPYWNYIDPSDRTMPAPFTDLVSALYTESRLPGLNEGQPIEPFFDIFLDVTNLMETRVYRVFNSTMDSAPHGAMHNYIGGAAAGNFMWNPIFQNEENFGLMALVASAGFDPIFWLHHANVDFI
jgi:hypothetical protein